MSCLTKDLAAEDSGEENNSFFISKFQKSVDHFDYYLCTKLNIYLILAIELMDIFTFFSFIQSNYRAYFHIF